MTHARIMAIVPSTDLARLGGVHAGAHVRARSRTFARGPALRLVRRSTTLARAHARLERRGFAAVLAARLMPGVPVSGLYYAAGVSPVRRGAFTAAIAIGALLRTTPYALLGQGLASGSAIPVIIAAASIAIGAGGAMLLLRQLRASVPAS